MAVGQNLRYLFGDDYPPKVVYFEGFWDVHRGTGVLTHSLMTFGTYQGLEGLIGRYWSDHFGGGLKLIFPTHAGNFVFYGSGCPRHFSKRSRRVQHDTTWYKHILC